MPRKVEIIESYIVDDNDYHWFDNYDELIRCKNCVYFTPEKSGEHWNVCKFYDAPKTADGYCNDAEPKEKVNGK